jgi:peptidoglycan/LPS O-acetylase OafA/YrhL
MVPPHFRTDLRLDALLWGAVIAFLAAENPLQFKGRPMAWTGVAAMAILCVKLYSMLSSVLLACFIPAILAATSLNPRWLFSRFLELPPLVCLGRISYGLYLWQGVFLEPLWRGTRHWWLRFPANLVVILAVASASYYLVESPVIRWRRERGKRVSARSAELVTVGES